MTAEQLRECREAFEKWAKDAKPYPYRIDFHESIYLHKATRDAWEGWKEAWNARAQAEDGESDEVVCEIVAHRLWYRTHDGRWELHGRQWIDGKPDPQLLEEMIEPAKDRWKLEYAYKRPSDGKSEAIPVYQARARGTETQWSDVNHNGFLAALAMRSMEVRVLYSVQQTITRQPSATNQAEDARDRAIRACKVLLESLVEFDGIVDGELFNHAYESIESALSANRDGAEHD